MGNKFYVYLHIKLDTGEPFYVGKGYKDRYKSKDNRNKYWHNIINKHGYDIIFLETDLSEKEAFNKETYWINRIGRNDLDNGPLVNFTNGGEGVNGYKHSEETKIKSGIKNIGKIPWNKGINMSEETKKKISKAGLGRVCSKETKLKISELCKNKIMYHQKLILNLETGIYYYSNGEAAIAMGKSETMCSRILRGRTKMQTSFTYC